MVDLLFFEVYNMIERGEYKEALASLNMLESTLETFQKSEMYSYYRAITLHTKCQVLNHMSASEGGVIHPDTLDLCSDALLSGFQALASQKSLQHEVVVSNTVLEIIKYYKATGVVLLEQTVTDITATVTALGNARNRISTYATLCGLLYCKPSTAQQYTSMIEHILHDLILTEEPAPTLSKEFMLHVDAFYTAIDPQKVAEWMLGEARFGQDEHQETFQKIISVLYSVLLLQKKYDDARDLSCLITQEQAMQAMFLGAGLVEAIHSAKSRGDRLGLLEKYNKEFSMFSFCDSEGQATETTLKQRKRFALTLLIPVLAFAFSRDVPHWCLFGLKVGGRSLAVYYAEFIASRTPKMFVVF